MAQERQAGCMEHTAGETLGWVMRYIRAVERGAWTRASEARERIPGLRERLRNIPDRMAREGAALNEVKDWATKLAREATTEDVEEIQKQKLLFF